MTESSTFIVLIYGFIGVSGALSLILLAWGFILYLARLGTERRVEGIKIMEWAVGLLITAIILIGVVRLVKWWLA